MSRNRDIANVLSKDTVLATDTELLTAGGLVYVGGTDFSAASTVSLDNVFSSTYENYLIYMKAIFATQSGSIYLKMRSSGTDNSTNYAWAGQYMRSGNTTWTNFGQSSSATQADIGDVGSNSQTHIFRIHISRPQLATPTEIKADLDIYDGSTIIGAQTIACQKDNTSFDGFTFYGSSSNLTSGTIRIYGYRNDNN